MSRPSSVPHSHSLRLYIFVHLRSAILCALLLYFMHENCFSFRFFFHIRFHSASFRFILNMINHFAYMNCKYTWHSADSSICDANAGTHTRAHMYVSAGARAVVHYTPITPKLCVHCTSRQKRNVFVRVCTNNVIGFSFVSSVQLTVGLPNCLSSMCVCAVRSWLSLVCVCIIWYIFFVDDRDYE